MPTWRGLVYFLRPLAQLRSSAPCTMFTRSKRAQKEPRKDGRTRARLSPALFSVFPGRQEPLMVAAESLFFPERSDKRVLRLGRQWMEGGSAGAHTHARLLLLTWKTSSKQPQRRMADTEGEHSWRHSSQENTCFILLMLFINKLFNWIKPI